MIELIEELKKVMEERELSPEGASRYIGCSAKSVYRWIYGEVVPSLVYRERIREAIDKIKRDYPVRDKKIQEGRYRLEVIQSFLHPSLKIKNKKKVILILSEMTANEYADIFLFVNDPVTAIKDLKDKFEIELIRTE